MELKTDIVFKTLFGEEVFEGLTHNPKRLSSKYFYDKRGDYLFQRIMEMPEYYLTDCEYKILDKYKSKITDWFVEGTEHFDLIELGAGDGKKTKILLKYLSEKKVSFCYTPIDISESVLTQLKTSLQEELPGVRVNRIQGTYFEGLSNAFRSDDSRKIILFLGSNIGNLKHRQAIEFLGRIRKIMQDKDLLFVGFDQKKNPQTILNAYNDKTGITEAFNKNILRRINTELGGNFNLDEFLHWEVYDPETGAAKSFLVAKEAQTVHIDQLNLNIHFEQWESIHTETSQKYDDEMVSWLAKEAKLEITAQFIDPDQWYKNYLFSREK